MSKKNSTRITSSDLARIISIGTLFGLLGASIGSLLGLSATMTLSAASGAAGVVAGAIVNRHDSNRQ